MTIDLEEMPPPAVVAEETSPNDTPAAAVETSESGESDLNRELESFLEITKHRIRPHGETPCPACSLLVHMDLNVCPHCESFIAANNALMRESVRRLGEIQAQLNGEHIAHSKSRKRADEGPSFGERMKRFFSGPKEDDAPSASPVDPTAPRLLRNTAEGDQLKVIEYDGPWFKVKTRDGQTGWVYSTLMIDR